MPKYKYTESAKYRQRKNKKRAVRLAAGKRYDSKKHAAESEKFGKMLKEEAADRKKRGMKLEAKEHIEVDTADFKTREVRDKTSHLSKKERAKIMEARLQREYRVDKKSRAKKKLHSKAAKRKTK